MSHGPRYLKLHDSGAVANPGRTTQSGGTAVATRTNRLLHIAYPLAALTLVSLTPSPARADFFDNARQTFTVDIPRFFTSDVPHFFQDDIPCAFGGQPTSHTRTSCNAPHHPAEQATDKLPDAAAAHPDNTNTVGNTPPSPNKY
jgi:hypothetical protein